MVLSRRNSYNNVHCAVSVLDALPAVLGHCVFKSILSHLKAALWSTFCSFKRCLPPVMCVEACGCAEADMANFVKMFTEFCYNAANM